MADDLQDRVWTFMKTQQKNQKETAAALGISIPTVRRILAGNIPSQATVVKVTTVLAQTKPVPPRVCTLYMDESIGKLGNSTKQRMVLGIVRVDQDQGSAFTGFAQTIYPVGWSAGDEVKSRGKKPAVLANVLTHSRHPALNFYAVVAESAQYPIFAPHLIRLYPYLAAAISVLAEHEPVAQVRLIVDNNSFTQQQADEGTRLLKRYFQEKLQQAVQVTISFPDSRESLGIQLSDFVAGAGRTLVKDDLAAAGVIRLPDLVKPANKALYYYLAGVYRAMVMPKVPVSQSMTTPHQVLMMLAQAIDVRLSTKKTLFKSTRATIARLLNEVSDEQATAVQQLAEQNWYDLLTRFSVLVRYLDGTPDKKDRIANICSALVGELKKGMQSRQDFE